MKNYIIIFLSFISINTFAQKHIPTNREKVKVAKEELNNQVKIGKIDFKTKKWDFGTFNENAGIVLHKFEFINVGNAPLKVTNVIASCGCTKTDWSNEEILPGGKGYINAGFDPKGRQGAFDKIITIQTNGDPAVLTLNIVGQVIPSVNDFGDIYRYQYGNIAVNNNNFTFAKVKDNGYDSTNIYLFNIGEKRFNINKLEYPNNILVDKWVDGMNPKNDMYLKVRYYPKQPVEYGPIKQEIKLYTNDDTLPIKIFYINATIVEDFSKLSEKELKKAPKAKFSASTIDFGDVSYFATPSTELKITNKGKKPLVIRKIVRSCNCLTIEPNKTVIKRGKTATVKISMGLANMAGPDTKNVKFILNDPANPEVTVDLKINVGP